MRVPIYFLPVFFLPIITSAQPENICSNSELNQRWEQAVTGRSQNQLVMKLSAKRIELCEAVQNGKLNSKAARTIWENTLMDALLANLPSTQAKQRRDLVFLFSNFIF